MLKRVRSLLIAEKEVARLRADLEKARARIRCLQKRLPKYAVAPKSIVWIFGGGRTGSTWLSAMMGEMPGHAVWFEPMIGELFDPERLQVGVREGMDFVFARRHRKTWLAAVRNFVLDNAGARFPQGPEVLVIKEPHGSAGAPMLSEALPESRMVLLVRDPRDVVASALDRYLNGLWQGTGGWGDVSRSRDYPGRLHREGRPLLPAARDGSQAGPRRPSGT